MIYKLYDKSSTDSPDLLNPITTKIGEIIEAGTCPNVEP
jgi:hypothetical protein